MEATARPWTVSSRFVICHGSMPLASMAFGYGESEKSEVNAAHIVHCVNTHDALCDLLTQVVKALEVANIAGKSLYAADITNRVREAITLAKGAKS